MNSDILMLINKHLEVMVSAEVQKQLVDYKSDNEIDQDITLTSAQESEVDTMIRDIINNELTISADHI
jgi:molybdopterin-biosynthesis enzyme MoeA-like protein